MSATYHSRDGSSASASASRQQMRHSYSTAAVGVTSDSAHHADPTGSGAHVSFADTWRCGDCGDCDSTRALPASSRPLHFVDTGAFHLRHSASAASLSCVYACAYDGAMNAATSSGGVRMDADILQEERRERQVEDHLLGRLNRRDSWDGHGQDLGRSLTAFDAPGDQLPGFGSVSGSVSGSGDDASRSTSGTAATAATAATVESSSSCTTALSSPTEAEVENEKQQQEEEAARKKVRDVATVGDLKAVISYLSSHRDDASVVRAACGEVRTRAPLAQMDISRYCCTHAAAVAQTQTPIGVVGALQPSPPTTLTRHATLAVANILPPHWVKVLILSMLDHPGNAPLQAEVLRTVWTVAALHPRFKSDVCDCGGIDAVVESMRRHGDDAEVQLYGCGALSCLSGSDQHVGRVWGAKLAVETVVDALKFKKDATFEEESGGDGVVSNSSDATEFALRTLLHFSASDAAGVSVKCRELDVTAVVLGAMGWHSLSREVLEWAFYLLSNLLKSHETSAGAACNEREEEKDGLSSAHSSDEIFGAVVSAMSEQVDDEDFKILALGLLCNLLAESMVFLSLSVAKCIANVSLNAMRQHSASPRLQKYGCWILSNLCCHSGSGIGRSSLDGIEDSRSIVTQLGGIETILQAMVNHQDNSELQAETFAALTCLCIDSVPNKDAVFEANGVKIILNAFRFHLGKSSEQSTHARDCASRALATLSVSPNNISELNASGMMVDIIKSTVDDGGSRSNSREEPGIPPVMMNLLALNCSSGDRASRNATTSSVIKFVLQAYNCAEEAEQAVSMLHTLSVSRECVDVLLSSSGAVGRIAQAIGLFPDSIVIQERSCGLLSNIYINADGRHRDHETLGSEGEIQAIINAMRKHGFHEEVQEYASLALRNFCVVFSTTIPSQTGIVSILLDAIVDVIQAMERNAHSARLQENATGLLWALAELTDELFLAVASSGGIQLILRAFIEFLDVAELQRETLGALALFSSVPETGTVIGTNEGTNAILRCMETFDDEEDVVARGSLLLSSISAKSHAAKVAIIEDDASIHRIVRCMRRYQNSSWIQKGACTTLANVAMDNPTREQIANEGGISRIQVAMNMFSKDLILQEVAIEALCSLVQVTPIDIILGNNILNSVIEAMLTHSEVLGIQEMGIDTLWHISARDPRTKRAVAEFGGIDVVVNAMQLHVGAKGLQEKGCITLWSLAVDDGISALVGQHISAIINGMLAHIAHLQLQLEALGALKTLATNIENKERLQKDTIAIDAIVSAMWVHGNQSRAQEAAFAALTNIAVNPVTNQVSTASHNELEAVISAMRHFSDLESVQEQGCILLRNYTFAPSNVTLMQSNPMVFQVLSDATERFPVKCGERANYVIQSLFD